MFINYLTVLAQTGKMPHSVDNTQVEYGTKYVLRVLDYIWQQATIMTWLQGVIAISFGVIVLMYGWRIYKTLTVIGFGIVGLYIGLWLGGKFDKEIMGSIVCAIIFMALALPLMRWAICVLGAAAGGILTAGVWHAFSQPQEFVWAGALIGIIAGGMLSFIIFKIAVMLFTSFSGAALVLMGAFALIYRYETFVLDPPTARLDELYYNQHWFLPLLMILFTAFGIILQSRFLKGTGNYAVESGKGGGG
ncbi:MAG: hypothetical protein JW947_08135 [Sedimentisphaerales bacterium]|nr:hypothetical protein [Sedimentisphaerales bacterium]